MGRYLIALMALVLILGPAWGITLNSLKVNNNPSMEGQTLIFTGSVSGNDNWKLRCGLSPGIYNLCSSSEWTSPNYDNTCSFINPFEDGDTNRVYCQGFTDNDPDVNVLPDNYGFETGDLTSWTDDRPPNTKVTTGEQFQGSWALDRGQDGAGPNVYIGLGTQDRDAFVQYFLLSTSYKRYCTTITSDESGQLLKIENKYGLTDYNFSHHQTFKMYTGEQICIFAKAKDQGGGNYRVYADFVTVINDINSNELFIDENTQLPLTDFLTCNKIDNVKSCIVDLNEVRVTPTNEANDAIFQLISASGTSRVIPIRMINSLSDGNQYFVYTSTDNINYDFDDTFTYGSQYDNPIQKIYNEASEKYDYSRKDTLTPYENKYYKFHYEAPFGFWGTMQNNEDWDVQLNPFYNDVNGYGRDQYLVSVYSNMRNRYKTKLPDINSTLNSNFVLQFNAYFSKAPSQNIAVGQVLPNGNDNTSNYAITKTEARYNMTVARDYPLFKTSNSSSSTIYMGEYSLLSKGYFVKPLELKTIDNLELPLMIGDNNDFYRYILEGQDFRIHSEIFDRDGKLDYYEIEAYIDGVNDANKVNYYYNDFEGGAGYTELNDVVRGLIDLTANAPDRSVKIILRVVDDEQNYSEVQSAWIKMLQYPHFPDDIIFNFSQINRKIGDYPEGSILLRMENPSLLRGVKFSILDSNSDLNAADYNVTIWKDTDFSCTAFDCSFNYTLDNYIFPKADFYRMRGQVLVKTEADSTKNPFLIKNISFPIFFKEIETARIFQGIERADLTYRNDEEIFLVLQVRDSDYSNLRNDFKAVLTYSECDAAAGGGNCRPIDVNFSPDSFAYDQKTGYNYYFFKELFYEEDYTPLSDGNHFRFYAILEDVTKKHNAVLFPLLTKKCKINSPTDFWSILFNMNEFLFGCSDYQEKIVTLNINIAQESRLLIDKDHNVQGPTQEALICLKPDNSNVYKDALSQDLDCTLVYTVGEQLPEKFNFYISNKFSDMAEKTDKYKQFLELTVPYEQILLNDPYLLKEALKTEFDTSVNTLGDAVFWGFNKLFTGFANPITEFTIEQFTRDKNGVFVNFGSDINFQKLFHPNNLSGLMFYKIKGLKVINVYDYRFNQDLQNAPPENFVKYMSQLGKTIPDKKTEIQVYASDFEKIISEKVNSRLVINEEIRDIPINKQNLDENQASNFDKVPHSLQFNITHDLVYNNERNTLRVFIPFRLVTLLYGNASIIDEYSAGLTAMLEGKVNPVDAFISWTFQNILIITVVLMILVIFAYIRGRRQ